MQPLLISVIIPVYNGGAGFERCLEALAATTGAQWECIVVDDGSTDGSAALAGRFGAEVLHSPRPRMGPAAARNLGAQAARGDVLFFIDADVLVQPHTVAQVAQVMNEQPEIAACFGSYDATPAAPNFLSQYRNLLHHYVHQTGSEEATTFWSGCGAIRRSVFLEMGGFNVKAYPRPSIEDIELGYRLVAAGQRIQLVKSLQVTHLKRWTVKNILTTDIRDRALPWTRLLLRQGALVNDLNLQTGQRVSVALAMLSAFFVFAAVITPLALLPWLFVSLALCWLNRRFYLFLMQQRGLGFVVCVLPWHWLYFVYSGVCFGGCLILHSVLRISNPAPLIVAKQVQQDVANA
jgi:glycosyltransferase involved in cell wall biosynthesis